MQDTIELIYKILRDDYNVTIALTPETEMSELGIDSVDLIGFLYSIEEKTQVKIPDEALGTDQLATLGSFANYIDARHS